MNKYLLLFDNTLTLLDHESGNLSEIRYQESRDGLMFIEPNGFKRWYSDKQIKDVDSLVQLIENI